MIVSHKHQFIYLAVAKTGTTSIETKYNHYDEGNFSKHMTLGELSFDYSNYFTFCFVRNPWSRLVSQYHQARKPINLGKPYRRYIHDLANKHSFRDFILHANKDFWKDIDQSRYYLRKGRLIDFVGKYENISSDLRKVCNLLNVEYIDIPKKNTTKHKQPYYTFYDDETRRAVETKCATDIETFGYKFESIL